jgi:Cof subfamily protein (haloacid dehalogenase superfamily)
VDADLLVCDLDGTLIDASMALDPALVAAFRAAAARGLRISIATGRMPLAVDRYREALEVRVPLIYYNGALLRDEVNGRDLLAHQLPRGILARALEVFSAAPVHPLFFRDEQVYCLEPSPDVRSFCDDEGLRAHVVPDPGEFLRLGAFVKAVFIGHPSDLALMRPDLEALAGVETRCVRTADRYLELLPAAATKGGALVELAAHLGVQLDRVVAVGDQENDLEMIRAAGLGVAMPHAPDAVRAAADRVAPMPRDGGLLALFAEILPEYFGLGVSG